jgi:hypothetical protein
LGESRKSAEALKGALATEAGMTARLRGAIDALCTQWGFDRVEEPAGGEPGAAYTNRLAEFGVFVKDRVRGALHYGVKRALAVFYSGFQVADKQELRDGMQVLSHGFVFDEDAPPEVESRRHQELVAEAEEPGARLAEKFESDVLPA